MRQSLKEYCTRFGREELLEQWHPEKNSSMTPDTVSYGSQKTIWWRCEKGHEWESRVYTRAGKNTGCPFCTGKWQQKPHFWRCIPKLQSNGIRKRTHHESRKITFPEAMFPYGGNAEKVTNGKP